jgi:hypothetical protein
VANPVGSRTRVLIEKTLPRATRPGKYWVWFPYNRDGKPDAVYAASTKLTILDPLGYERELPGRSHPVRASQLAVALPRIGQPGERLRE